MGRLDGAEQPSLYAAFDRNLDAARPDATTPLLTEGEEPEYRPGVRGEAVRLWGWERNRVRLPGSCVSPESGTIAFWLRKSDVGGGGWPLVLLQPNPMDGRGPKIQFDERHSQWNASLGAGATCSLPFQQSSPEAWHHLALTWASAGQVALYFDGRLLGANGVKKAPPTLDWNFQELGLSCGLGPVNRHVDLDELRCYPRALSATEILELIRADALVDCELNRIAPSERVVEGARNRDVERAFAIEAATDVEAIFHLQTLGPGGEALWQNELPVKLTAGSRALLTWVVPIGERGGPATLKATLRRGEGGPSWAADIVRLPTDPRRPAPALNESRTRLLQVDATLEPDEQRFTSSASTTVATTPTGRYRESGPKQFDWFAYRFDIANPGRAHMLVVTYPDDKPRTMAFDISDGSGLPPQGAGVLTGAEASGTRRGGGKTGHSAQGAGAVIVPEVSGRLQRREMVFWPATKQCALFVANWHVGTPAAIASFEVFEVSDGQLPALPISALPKDGMTPRRFGTYVEDASMMAYWGADRAPARLPQWQTTAENLAAFLQYTGQNVYLYPMFWYGGTLFPSPTNDAFGHWEEVRTIHPDGAYDLMLSTFAQHDIKLVSVLSVKEMGSLRLQTDRAPEDSHWPTYLPPPDWEQRVRGDQPGGNDMLQVLRTGESRQTWVGTGVPGGSFLGPIYNPLHPAVRRVMEGLVDDWLRLYGGHPALGGIALDFGGWGGAPGGESLAFERLDGDYSDFTVNRFATETGAKVPGEAGQPNRFQARYDFLTTPPMKEKWIRWRCEKIRDEVILPLARKVWERRPDLDVMLMLNGNNQVGSPLLGKPTTWDEALRECGIDLAMYRDIPRLTPLCLLLGGESSGVSYPQSALPEVMTPFLSARQAAVLGKWSPYWEYFQPLYAPAAKKWPETKPSVAPVRTITEQDMSMLRDGIMALAQGDVATLLVGGMGQNPWQGHHAGVSQFARAFRALPAVKFEDVKGLEDPVRVRQWRDEEETYVYLLNTETYPVTVELQMDCQGGDATATDLVSDAKRQLVSGQPLKVEVPALQLCAWRLQRAAVAGGHAVAPAAELENLRAQYERIRQALKDAPSEMAGLDAAIHAALEAGQSGRARVLLIAAQFRMPEVELKRQEDGAPYLNWVLIGPFDTDRSKKEEDLDIVRPVETGLLALTPQWDDRYTNASGKVATPKPVRSHWRPHKEQRGEGAVDLDQHYAAPVLVYAVTNLESDREKEIALEVGWDDWASLWLNGEKILDGKRQCMGMFPAERTLPVRLRKGDNVLVFKILNGGGPGGFYLQPRGNDGNWPAGVSSVAPKSGP
jgi:hypothetical protein